MKKVPVMYSTFDSNNKNTESVHNYIVEEEVNESKSTLNLQKFEEYIKKYSKSDQAEMLHLFVCKYYQNELENSFEVDNNLSLSIKEILKDLFRKVC